MLIVTLSNGKKVGNFSSPHPFEFEDGSVLPAVSPEEAERLAVHFIEEELSLFYGNSDSPLNGIKGDVSLKFKLTDDIRSHMTEWNQLHLQEKVDVVYCPLPMITALHEAFGIEWIRLSPFRAIRIEDRIKKKVSIHKQCV